MDCRHLLLQTETQRRSKPYVTPWKANKLRSERSRARVDSSGRLLDWGAMQRALLGTAIGTSIAEQAVGETNPGSANDVP